jgi:unsaturated rhamnogalacturonyl hydrolase
MIHQMFGAIFASRQWHRDLPRVVFSLAAILSICGAPNSMAQEQPWSQRMANNTMQHWPMGRFRDASTSPDWNYQLAVLLEGMEAEWKKTGDKAIFQYIQQSMDQLVEPDGSIPAYHADEQSTDDILLGRQLLLLYRVTGEDKYRKAAILIRQQLTTHPRNASGGFCHTRRFPTQMLLDDVYMIAPFYAEYALTFQEPEDFSDITKQFVLLEDHTRDRKSGLLYQEWNEPQTEWWVSKATGTSASFWARGTGWYIMALVDTLPYYPKDNPDRAKLLAILSRTADGITRHQDRKSGLWYQVLDKPNEKGNYLESSASGMFIYALAKGVRLGYLPKHYSANAQRGWKGMLDHFVETAPDGSITITSTVKSIDLGSAPSHDGSYAYYTSAPVINNDPKGVGAFLLASTEIELTTAKEKGRPDAEQR